MLGVARLQNIMIPRNFQQHCFLAPHNSVYGFRAPQGVWIACTPAAAAPKRAAATTMLVQSANSASSRGARGRGRVLVGVEEKPAPGVAVERVLRLHGVRRHGPRVGARQWLHEHAGEPATTLWGMPPGPRLCHAL